MIDIGTVVLMLALGIGYAAGSRVMVPWVSGWLSRRRSRARWQGLPSSSRIALNRLYAQQCRRWKEAAPRLLAAAGGCQGDCHQGTPNLRVHVSDDRRKRSIKHDLRLLNRPRPRRFRPLRKREAGDNKGLPSLTLLPRKRSGR